MTRALLIIDVQNDFCEGGSLAVAGGARVAGDVASLVEIHASGHGSVGYDMVIASQDWHVEPGEHFASYTGAPPDYASTWPDHCVAGSPGAELHPALDHARASLDYLVRKGQDSAAYSAFEGSAFRVARRGGDGSLTELPLGIGLAELLKGFEVTDVDVCGIATDYCVKASVLDALAAGFNVRVLLSLCAGVAMGTSLAAVTEMHSAGAEIVEGAIF